MNEISLHILDIVQNSIAAGAQKLRLEVGENQDSNLFWFEIEDNGCGMDQEIVASVTDPFVTTRTTRKLGLGLPLLDMNTKQCGGKLVIESEKGKGTLVRAEFELNHWDRPPLGNMKATLMSIMVLNEQIDFTYCHRVNDREFCFALSDIIAQLDGVPLSEGWVLGWLEEFLASGFDYLNGGTAGEDG